MAFTCGFFNSVGHDRKYDAVQHGMIFDGIITDGIYATYLKAMVVKASENASEVIVQPGRAWFNHTWSYNDSDYPVAAPEPEVVLDRIDTLVLDVNSEDAVRNNQFLWVQGTPTSQTPEPPALIHTATHNQYPLCDVYRQAGTTMIYAADITNRVGTSDCPFVTGVLESINIDDLLAQWDDEFHTWENATKASFEGWMVNQQSVYTAWFTALKTQMAGDVADVEAWVQTIKDIIDEETATHLQLEIDEINSMLPSGSHITVTTSDTELYSRTVTITDEDNNTVTSQFDANGVAVFKSVPYVGNLTITSTDGVRTATEVVNTPYFARYEFTLAFWSATVNIIGDSVLGGDTVTITDSTTALVGTVVLNASGAGVFNATYPDTYKFSVTHGGETMEVSLAVTQETTYNVEIHAGLNYQAWLNAGRVSKSFSSLDEVLEDEKALRQLFLVHDAVDYICDSFNAGSVADITKIFNTDLAAKWINLSDYALDHFYAVADIKSIMDTADKYGYGEWVITDSTTTPPTWGPKGNVPTMTANNAPYGVASAYQVFDGNTSTTASGTDFSYKFVNPICPKDFYCNVSGGTLQASNDGSTWSVPTSGSYYLYLRLHFASSVSPHTIQFYGRELKVSVPKMTSNTAPFGTASAKSSLNSSYLPWKVFDNDASTHWYSNANIGEKDSWVAYEFISQTKIRMAIVVNANTDSTNIASAGTINIKDNSDNVLASDTFSGGTRFSKIFDISSDNVGTVFKCNIAGSNGLGVTLTTVQFYGLDYSEKEFEVGTTKKWLYDHGVELEPLGEGIISGTNSVATKENEQLYIYLSGTSKASAFMTTSPIDMTPYKLMMGVLGNKYYASTGNNPSTAIGVKSTRTHTSSDNTLIASVNFVHGTNAELKKGVDLSSVTGQSYPIYRVYTTTSSTTHYGTLTEWWLE